MCHDKEPQSFEIQPQRSYQKKEETSSGLDKALEHVDMAFRKAGHPGWMLKSLKTATKASEREAPPPLK